MTPSATDDGLAEFGCRLIGIDTGAERMRQLGADQSLAVAADFP